MNKFFVLNTDLEISTEENFLGYVVFFNKSKDEKTAEIQINLLHKLIQNALKLSLDNFLFIDLNTQKIRLSELRKSIKIEKCFLFGVTEEEIGINIKLQNYKISTISDIEFLKVDAPEKMEINKNLKNQLWEQLQISFKLIK